MLSWNSVQVWKGLQKIKYVNELIGREGQDAKDQLKQVEKRKGGHNVPFPLVSARGRT